MIKISNSDSDINKQQKRKIIEEIYQCCLQSDVLEDDKIKKQNEKTRDLLKEETKEKNKIKSACLLLNSKTRLLERENLDLKDEIKSMMGIGK